MPGRWCADCGPQPSPLSDTTLEKGQHSNDGRQPDVLSPADTAPEGSGLERIGLVGLKLKDVSRLGVDHHVQRIVHGG